MEATELRIGNYINPKINGIILTNEIHKVDPTTLIIISKQIDNRNIEFEPIPLTEEILLKCGFHELNEFENTCIDKENFIETSSVLEDEFYIGKNKETGFYHFLTIDTFQGDDLFFKIISAPMQYLHTLQNYYPTFKGEELEINL